MENNNTKVYWTGFCNRAFLGKATVKGEEVDVLDLGFLASRYCKEEKAQKTEQLQKRLFLTKDNNDRNVEVLKTMGVSVKAAHPEDIAGTDGFSNKVVDLVCASDEYPKSVNWVNEQKFTTKVFAPRPKSKDPF